MYKRIKTQSFKMKNGKVESLLPTTVPNSTSSSRKRAFLSIPWVIISFLLLSLIGMFLVHEHINVVNSLDIMKNRLGELEDGILTVNDVIDELEEYYDDYSTEPTSNGYSEEHIKIDDKGDIESFFLENEVGSGQEYEVGILTVRDSIEVEEYDDDDDSTEPTSNDYSEEYIKIDENGDFEILFNENEVGSGEDDENYENKTLFNDVSTEDSDLLSQPKETILSLVNSAAPDTLIGRAEVDINTE